MKLYQVFNGYMGDAPLSVIVVAENEEQAKELARDKFKQFSRGYGEKYYSNLRVEEIFDDLSKPNARWLEC